jgi:hypothetical protein
VDDPDLEIVNQDDDVGSPVGSPDADVVQLAVEAKADGPGLIDPIPTDP